ncbi:hypothetical protein FAZ95_01025 [Trinickia violacea]|uniref:Uncharacterized protein n=1 Tax=Trinickia violacea TaxID=2571746 RepID=A0A4P8IGZ0_9BURK|nr:hypothetical protein [Trinickia violacea]QCP47888.1 hypothetical protein FAZ95_01025 [Trinickia violacea]
MMDNYGEMVAAAHEYLAASASAIFEEKTNTSANEANELLSEGILNRRLVKPGLDWRIEPIH